MSERFCLLDEPWIPCERDDGSRVDLGIARALTGAEELRAIAAASPLITAALHRLLLAILHRVFGPRDLAEWIALYLAGRFDAAALGKYFDLYRDRFDLFHPERPFYQVRGLPFEADRIDVLVTERTSWGGGVHLFEHRPDGVGASLTPAEAGRWLLAAQAFSSGGLVKKRGEPVSASAAPLNRGAIVLIRGANLFETLMLNLLRYRPPEDLPIPGTSDDAPAWEREPLPRSLPMAEEPRRVPAGWLDLLTWQSRRLELKVKDGLVVGCVRCVGQGLREGSPRDPMMAWKIDPKRGPFPLGLDAERAFWRDSHALFLSTEVAREVERPRTLNQLASSELRTTVPEHRKFELEIFGMDGDRAAILLVRSETLPLSPRLLENPDIETSIRDVLILAEETARVLRNGLYLLTRTALAPGERSPDSGDIAGLIKSLGAEGEFWSKARAYFESYLLAVTENEARAENRFAEDLRREAHRCFEVASRALGASARALKGAALGRAQMDSGFGRLSPTNRGGGVS